MSHTQPMAGWGYYPTLLANLHELDTGHALLPKSQKGLLAWGMGRSYGDAALAADLIPMRQNRRILSFDKDTGCITVEAGVSLRELMAHTFPVGWWPPVLPGTAHVTVGGAIAADVHGKNHHNSGSFNSCVTGFDLLTPNGEILHCSDQEQGDLFTATMGGMGLTGIILRATLQLVPTQGAWVRRITFRCRDLEEMLEKVETRNATWSVAWVDGSSGCGRGLLHLGDPADRAGELKDSMTVSLPLRPPISLVNALSLRAFNTLVWATSPARPEAHSLQHIQPFFWPLDAVDNWNRAYGKAGFLQYQCLLPWNASNRNSSRHFLYHALAQMREACGGSALTVLKIMGENPGGGPLAFGAAGVTLAADLPRTTASVEVVRKLNFECAENGGRVYLAKDALLDAGVFRRMYPAYEEFLQLLSTIDPQGIMGGLMARRLGLRR